MTSHTFQTGGEKTTKYTIGYFWVGSDPKRHDFQYPMSVEPTDLLTFPNFPWLFSLPAELCGFSPLPLVTPNVKPRGFTTKNAMQSSLCEDDEEKKRLTYTQKTELMEEKCCPAGQQLKSRDDFTWKDRRPLIDI